MRRSSSWVRGLSLSADWGIGGSSGGSSGRAGSLPMAWITSMRNPSTPRSSQNRRMSCMAASTSGFAQFRSGCSGRNRWRYHWPAAGSSVHAGASRNGRASCSGARRRAVPPDVPVALGSVAARPGRDEPGCWSRRVVRHPVDDEAQARGVGLGEQPVEVVERPEHGVDVAVVAHVVAEVGHRGAVEGRQPEGVDAQPDQVVEVRRMPSRSPTPSPSESANDRGRPGRSRPTATRARRAPVDSVTAAYPTRPLRLAPTDRPRSARTGRPRVSSL